MRRTRQLRVPNRDLGPRLPILGIDIFGVLNDNVAALLPLIKTKYGLDIRPEDITDISQMQKRIIDHTGNANEVYGWFRRTIDSPEFILQLEPDRDAIEAWPQILELPIEPRLLMDLGQNETTIAAGARWALSHGFQCPIDPTRLKDGWARQVRARWMVEDSPGYCQQLGEAGILTLMIARPYNERFVYPGINRVGSLLDVVAYIRHDLEYDGR